MLKLIGELRDGGKYWIDDKPRFEPKPKIQPKYAKGKRAHGKEKASIKADGYIRKLERPKYNPKNKPDRYKAKKES